MSLIPSATIVQEEIVIVCIIVFWYRSG